MPEDSLRRTGTEQGAVEAAGIHGPGAGLPPLHTGWWGTWGFQALQVHRT